jgi:hypothetical protein
MGVCRLQSQPHSLSLSRSTRGNQTKFDTIASACGLGIGLDNFIAMTRLARTSDSSAARFLDAWDALGTSEVLSAATADAVCEQIGLAPLDLLKAVADATIRFAMYTARLRAAVAMPSIVERSIEVALTDQGVADRKMQLQHSGFLPIPAGSQTNIAIVASNATFPLYMGNKETRNGTGRGRQRRIFVRVRWAERLPFVSFTSHPA